MKERIEIVLLVGAILAMNAKWIYFTPKPKHAWHHRAQGRGHWHWRPGDHRGGHRGLAAAGRAR
jgi:hypothetical protein